jgi:hypothetical protein
MWFVSKKKYQWTLDEWESDWNWWSKRTDELEKQIVKQDTLLAHSIPQNIYLGSPQTRIDSHIPQWEREEKEWGYEAYAKGNVRIEAEAIDEDDGKEPGYTRARVSIFDSELEDSPALAAAKAVTEEAKL